MSAIHLAVHLWSAGLIFAFAFVFGGGGGGGGGGRCYEGGVDHVAGLQQQTALREQSARWSIHRVGAQTLVAGRTPATTGCQRTLFSRVGPPSLGSS